MNSFMKSLGFSSLKKSNALRFLSEYRKSCFLKLLKSNNGNFLYLVKKLEQFTLKIILSVSVAINETLSGTKAGFNTS